METRKWFVMSGTVALAVLLMLALAIGLTQAQGPAEQAQVQSEGSIEVVAPGAIGIQGRLTDPSGNPVPDGTYTVVFSIYDSEAATTALCSDSNDVVVQNGLFSSWIDYCHDGVVYGQKLWLGVRVEGDAEMTPRQVIYAVPYALTLRPGAVISDTQGQNAALRVRSTGTGLAVFGGQVGVQGESVNGEGVVGLSVNGEGLVGQGGAIGVTARSDTGVAIRAGGTGVIQSTAPSYLWISGNGVRPFHQSDATVIDMDTIGGAMIRAGTGGGNRTVMLPITEVGPLYGQDVTATALDIYWRGETEFDSITAVILRRQTGVCATCYENIVYDLGTSYVCNTMPEGCTVHYNLTENNVLTADSGILYLALGLAFNSDTSYIELGGVRLTLEHD